MAKEGNSTVNSFWQELFTLAQYKRSQGRIARQATFVVMAAIICLGVWSLKESLVGRVQPIPQYAIAGTVLAIGLWLAYRAVNMPRFADFLIAVEAEMNKVSWPSRTELIRASIVVLVVIFGMAALLFLYDLLWQWTLTFLGVIDNTPPVVPPAG